MSPWKFVSRMLTVTSTPSARQLTTMSGRGKSVLISGGGGMGTVGKKSEIIIKNNFLTKSFLSPQQKIVSFV